MFCLRVCLCVPHTCTAQGHQNWNRIPWNWSQGWLRLAVWVLGIKACPLEEHVVMLTAELFLQPQANKFERSVWPGHGEMVLSWSSPTRSLSVWPVLGLLIVLWMTDCLHPKPDVECGHAAVPEHRRVCLNRRAPCLAVQGDSSMSCCSAPTTHAHDWYLLFFPVSRRFEPYIVVCVSYSRVFSWHFYFSATLNVLSPKVSGPSVNGGESREDSFL